MRLRISLFLLFVLSTLACYAATVTVRGRIVDANGAILPNLRLLVTGLDNKIVAEPTSDARGEFSFNAPPGEYNVDVQIPGSAGFRRIFRASSGTSYLTLRPDAGVRSSV